MTSSKARRAQKSFSKTAIFKTVYKVGGCRSYLKFLLLFSLQSFILDAQASQNNTQIIVFAERHENELIHQYMAETIRYFEPNEFFTEMTSPEGVAEAKSMYDKIENNPEEHCYSPFGNLSYLLWEVVCQHGANIKFFGLGMSIGNIYGQKARVSHINTQRAMQVIAERARNSRDITNITSTHALGPISRDPLIFLNLTSFNLLDHLPSEVTTVIYNTDILPKFNQRYYHEWIAKYAASHPGFQYGLLNEGNINQADEVLNSIFTKQARQQQKIHDEL